MKVFIKVKPRSKEAKIEKVSENIYMAWVKSPAEEGKANAELIKLVSRYFEVPIYKVKIRLGQGSRQKILEID